MRILSVVFFLLAFGCNSDAQKNAELSADEFEKGLANKEVQLLDVRTAGEFRNGHIKGSLQANWNDQQEFTDRISSLDKTKPVFVYCLSGGRSRAAAAWLIENGFENVVNMEGGFNSWKRSGKPVEGMADIKQMTLADYQQQITGKEYVLVDFGAEWCPPCRKMEPIINEFLAENKLITFLKIDGGIHTDLMKQLNAEGLPTFILLKNGQEVWRNKGVLTKEELNKIWLEKK
jgi:rhodanese-related sulfurtransferase